MIDYHNDKEYDKYRIYVRNLNGKYFLYNIVSSYDAKVTALNHLDSLENVSEYLVVGVSEELNMDEVCDMKNYGRTLKKRRK